MAPDAPQAPRALPYLPGLDGLRGLAVAGVLLFHGGVSWMGGGFLGVSLFFTLSGFLITSLLLREQDRRGTVALGAFWNRRFRRLLPAALLAVLLATAFTVAAATAAQQAGFRGDAFAALAYVANWRFVVAGESYGALFAAPSPLLHFWSLAIEEQFYLFFPLLIWAVLRVGRGSHRMVGAVLGALFVASAALPHLVTWSDDRVYFGTDTRAAELLAGALLAVVLARRPLDEPLTGRAAGALRWLGVVDLVLLVGLWATSTQSDRWIYDGGLPVYAGLSALVILAALDPRNPVTRLLAVPPLRELGRISYGVYLYHWPIFLWLSPTRTGWPSWLSLAVGTAVTVGVAYASFRLVEQPIRERRGWGARFPVMPLAPALAASVAILVAAATLSVHTEPTDAAVALAPGSLMTSAGSLPPLPEGGGDVVPADAVPVGAGAATSGAAPTTPPTTRRPGDARDVEAEAAAATPPPTQPVRPPNRPLRVLVIGDSAGAFLTPGLNDWGLAHGIWGAANFARIGCGIGRGGLRDHRGERAPVPAECDGWPTDWAAAIAENRPDLIVVVDGFWDATDRLLPGDDTWRGPGDPVYDDFLRREWGAAADLLLSSGVPVAWLDNPPIRLGLDEVPPDPDRYAANDPARMVRLNELLAEVAATRPGLRVVPWRSYVMAWPGGPFATDLRPDGMHLDDRSSRVVADWLGPELLAAYWSVRGA